VPKIGLFVFEHCGSGPRRALKASMALSFLSALS
jgi:hypothetical protein